LHGSNSMKSVVPPPVDNHLDVVDIDQEVCNGLRGDIQKASSRENVVKQTKYLGIIMDNIKGIGKENIKHKIELSREIQSELAN
ncbi:hypothetical protein L9F63_007428, partial [Diploptera punctata]